MSPRQHIKDLVDLISGRVEHGECFYSEKELNKIIQDAEKLINALCLQKNIIKMD